MASTFFLVIYSDQDFSLAEEIGIEISSELNIEYAMGTFSNPEDVELAKRFLVRSRQKIAESFLVCIVASDQLFGNFVLSEIAEDAINAKKSLCIFLPTTKNFPAWFPKLESVRLVSDSTIRNKELEAILKKATTISNKTKKR